MVFEIWNIIYTSSTFHFGLATFHILTRGLYAGQCRSKVINTEILSVNLELVLSATNEWYPIQSFQKQTFLISTFELLLH